MMDAAREVHIFRETVEKKVALNFYIRITFFLVLDLYFIENYTWHVIYTLS